MHGLSTPGGAAWSQDEGKCLSQEPCHDNHAHWWQLVEHIVQLEELIADLSLEDDDSSAIFLRQLSKTLEEKRKQLRSSDIG